MKNWEFLHAAESWDIYIVSSTIRTSYPLGLTKVEKVHEKKRIGRFGVINICEDIQISGILNGYFVSWDPKTVHN